MLALVAASQVISNVRAALLLSGFTTKKGNYMKHFTVTNVGILAVMLGVFWIMFSKKAMTSCSFPKGQVPLNRNYMEWMRKDF